MSEGREPLNTILPMDLQARNRQKSNFTGTESNKKETHLEGKSNMIILAQVYWFWKSVAKFAKQKTIQQIPLWRKRRGFVNNPTIFM